MGKRGPKPTPTAMLAARGSWRAKAPDRKDEPQIDPCEPTMPPGLGLAGRAEWKRTVPRMAAHQMLTELDRTNLFLMCKALDEHSEADKAIKEHGLLVDGASGNKVLNPAVHERQRAWARYVKLSAAFGMTASDRSRVKGASGKEAPKSGSGGGNISKFFKAS